MQAKMVLKIEGMTCKMCVKHVAKALQGVAGVLGVEVNLEDAQAQLSYDPALADLPQFKAAVDDAGYKVID